MRDENDAAVRLGLALYRKTILEGENFYSLYDLVFEDLEKKTPRTLFERFFSGPNKNFWSTQAEIAGILGSSGIAQTQRKQMSGMGAGDYSLKLTPLGRAVYSLAYLQSDNSSNEIEGIRIEDLAYVLSQEEKASALSGDLEKLDSELDKLQLTNYQRATAGSYVRMLVLVSGMPDPDAKLFWTILERVSHFAGVASLIVALIALRLGR